MLAALERLFFGLFFNQMRSKGRLVAPEAAFLKGRAYVTNGSGNRLEIGAGARFNGTVEFNGDGNRVVIGRKCNFKGRIVVKGSNQTVLFDDHSTAKNAYILCDEDCDVSIGKWCMFSRRVEIRTSDAHSVIDRDSGERLNQPASVTIGDHVWIGIGAIVTKGAAVPSDCIVAAMSFVNDRFDEQGVVLAGVPAAIVRRGVTWHRSRKPRFEREQMDAWKADVTRPPPGRQ
jgi:acetyltransferase-like isoleucine patch superfamily enzyme